MRQIFRAPQTGLEPVTPRLTAVCSTIELLGHLISKSTALLSSSALTPSGAFKTEHRKLFLTSFLSGTQATQ